MCSKRHWFMEHWFIEQFELYMALVYVLEDAKLLQRMMSAAQGAAL